jgi:hypothetical protein
LAQAHRHGIKVVAWYYPTFVDVHTDLDRLVRLARFSSGGQRFDGVAVDIEDAVEVKDPSVRSDRLVELSRRLRAALGPGPAIGAIVLPAVQIDVINPFYWPGFPWKQIKPYYDVWLPMAYSTVRAANSPYHDADAYAAESVRRMRSRLGDSDAAVHPIGGVGDKLSADDTIRFLQALRDTDALGGSIYDYRTTGPAVWAILRQTPTVLAAAPESTTTVP